MFLTLFVELINYYQSVMIKLIKHRIDMNKTRAEDDNIIVCQPFIELMLWFCFVK